MNLVERTQKIIDLFIRKQQELNVTPIEFEYDIEMNIHVICHREYDDSYIVWTSYNTGDENSYSDFSHGWYDIKTLDNARIKLKEKMIK